VSDLVGQLRARREALGLTQAQLADLAGAQGQSTISCYETGKHGPSMRMLLNVADALGCDVRLVPRDGAV
jgi:transcriptional regulator with XRE-family HTH domain